MNNLESQLRSWVPRGPSAKLESRLFPRPRAETVVHFRLNWLAPASVPLLVLGLFVSQHRSPVAASASTGPIIAMILSNQSAAAFLPVSPSAEQNRLPHGYEGTLSRGGSSSSNLLPFSQIRIRPGP